MPKEENPPDETLADTEVRKKSLQSILAVSFYMSVSMALVFLNRFVLTDKTEKAGGLFISWFQFVVAYICIIIITIFCPNVPLLNLFPPLRYNFKIVLKVIPVSVTYLLMIGLNNKCLEYVSITGYQIVRSLTILFSIILSFLFQGQKTSLKAMLACMGVVAGFCLGVQGDLDLTLKGALLGVMSSCFVASYSIVVKQVMGLLDNNQYVLIEYNTPIAIVILTPIVWFNGEFDILMEKRTTKFWIMQTTAGVVGFVINIAIFLNIKYTTPLTHNLSGTLKACLQTVLAYILFPDSETMTPKKALATVLVIGFSAYYAAVRRSEMKQKIEYELLQQSKQDTSLIEIQDTNESDEDDKVDPDKPEKREVA